MRLQSTPFLKDRTFIKYHPTERVSKALFRERERKRERHRDDIDVRIIIEREDDEEDTLLLLLLLLRDIYIYA